MAGTGFFDITLRRPGSPIIGNFVPKFSPSGSGNSLTHSNLRPSNARSEIFLDRNENHSAPRLRAHGDSHVPRLHQSRSKISQASVCDYTKIVAVMHNAS